MSTSRAASSTVTASKTSSAKKRKLVTIANSAGSTDTATTSATTGAAAIVERTGFSTASPLATDSAATDALIAEEIRSQHVFQQSGQVFQQAMMSSDAQLVSSFDKLANIIVAAFAGRQEAPSARASPYVMEPPDSTGGGQVISNQQQQFIFSSTI